MSRRELEAAGIVLRNPYRPGEHRAPCPRCDRGPRDDALSVKIDADGATWWCHRCGWRDGTKRPNGSAAPKAKPDPKGKPSSFEAILPVPEGAPAPSFKHRDHGQPSMTWAYRDTEGRLLLHVARFELPGGRKQTLPLVYGSTDGRPPAWRWKHPPAPKPLFKLDQLAARPDAPVLVTEGEKTSTAAAERFPGMVVVTWLGGTGGEGKADWAPLAGRSVTIWPDHDAPGIKAANSIALKLTSSDVRIVPLPPGLPEGWDLADPLPEGLDPAELIATAEPVAAEPEASDPDDDRPTFQVKGGVLAANVFAAERVIGDATLADPAIGIYQRGPLLVRVARVKDQPAATDPIKRAIDSLTILHATSDFLRLQLSVLARWEKYSRRYRSWFECDPPPDVARTLGEASGFWRHIPRLTGIVEAPCLRPDGSVFEAPGYDQATGLYFDPHRFLTHPGQAHAPAGLRRT